jgi:hypothetical protein
MKYLIAAVFASLSLQTLAFAQNEAPTAKVCEVVTSSPGEYYKLKLGDRNLSIVGYTHGTMSSVVKEMQAVHAANEAVAAGATCDNALIEKVVAVTDSEAEHNLARRAGYQNLIKATDFAPAVIGVEAAFEDTQQEIDFNKYLRDEVEKFAKNCHLENHILLEFIRPGIVSPGHLFAQETQLFAVGIESKTARDEAKKYFPILEEFNNSSVPDALKLKIRLAINNWIDKHQFVEAEFYSLQSEITDPAAAEIYNRLGVAAYYFIARDDEMARYITYLFQFGDVAVIVGDLHLEILKDKMLAECKAP